MADTSIKYSFLLSVRECREGEFVAVYFANTSSAVSSECIRTMKHHVLDAFCEHRKGIA